MPTTPPTVSTSEQLNDYRTYRKNSAPSLKTARFSPYKLPRKRPSSLQLTSQPYAHPDPLPPTFTLPVVSDPPHSIHEGEQSANTRHVKLDFDLFRNGKQCTPSKEQIDVIMSLFPTCQKLSFASPFLIITCRKLPAKPWPVTVAGLPLYMTTDDGASPMDRMQIARGPKVSVDATIQSWQTPDLDIFKKLFVTFDSFDAKIHRIQWIGWCFLAVGASEPYPDWKARLPFVVNNIAIGYVFGEQTVHENALRLNLPAGRRILDGEADQDYDQEWWWLQDIQGMSIMIR